VSIHFHEKIMYSIKYLTNLTVWSQFKLLERTKKMSILTRWVDLKPAKSKYIRPVFYPNPKYTRPVFYPNPNTPDPYLTRPPELTGLIVTIDWINKYACYYVFACLAAVKKFNVRQKYYLNYLSCSQSSESHVNLAIFKMHAWTT